jgi:hypothetical protein
MNIRQLLKSDVPWAYHIAVAAFIALMWTLSRIAPDRYYQIMQEDRFVEWWTVAFFLAAGILGLARAIPARRLGDLLVALFCVAAAGEEVSWGQRLIGYTPPETFLAHNIQQEVNVHNMFQVFGQPKWTLILILSLYGVAPLLNQVPALARIATKLRFTVPSLAVTCWIAVVIGLLIVYPTSFAGEWLEAIAGSLFFVGLRPGKWLAPTAALGAVFAGGLDRVSAVRADLGERGKARVECAIAEATALRDAIVRISPNLLDGRRVHRRLWTLQRRRQTDTAVMRALTTIVCNDADAESTARRRAYGVDPWGTAYWVRTRSDSAGRPTLMVYSFGPNRRRDFDRSGHETGDDVIIRWNE